MTIVDRRPMTTRQQANRQLLPLAALKRIPGRSNRAIAGRYQRPALPHRKRRPPMQLTISRTELARAVGAVGKVVEARNTIPILSNLLLSADGGQLQVTGTDLDIQATATAVAEVQKTG